MSREASAAAGKLSPSEYRNLLRMTKPGHLWEVLSEGFCGSCRLLLQERLRNFLLPTTGGRHHCDRKSEGCYHADYSPESHRHRHRSPEKVSYSRSGDYASDSPTENKRKRKRTFAENPADLDLILDDGIAKIPSAYFDVDVSEERKEEKRLSKVKKREFVHMERVEGRVKNVLQGLELHTGVFNNEEQKNIVDYVYHLQRKGQRGQLRKSTYSEPIKWMRGKGRSVTIQFGCCYKYNYAKDKNGTPPGIVRDEEVDPLPCLFKKMIKRMVKWNILPVTTDSCIVNIYDEGDGIPPHIDHLDVYTPFCTLSFLTESNIVYGPASIPLPKGSVMVFSGNGVDLADHCVPSVPAKRISITFRKMDGRKLERIKPLDFSQLQQEEEMEIVEVKQGRERSQRDHRHYRSSKLLELPRLQESREIRQVRERGKRQRDHHHYYSPKGSSQRSRR